MRVWILAGLFGAGCADKEDLGGSSEVGPANKVPSAPGIAIDPSSPDTQTDLVAIIETPATDGDGDEISYRYAWRQDGALRDDLDSAIVDSVYTRRGEVWTVEVEAIDGISEGPAVTDEVEIRNSLPELNTLTVTPSAVDVMSEVECTPGTATDLDHDPVGVMTRWVLNNTELEVEGPLLGEHFGRGDEIVCRAYLDDGVETVTQDSRVVVVENAAPWVVGVTLSHNNPTPSDVLEAIPEGWWDDDDDSEGYLYAWYINWAFAAETATIDSTVFSPGDNIFVEMTAFDGITVGNTVSSHSATAVD
jgi:hypothetical protein